MLEISESLSGEEKLQALRKIPEQDLVDALPKLKMSNFRGVTDGAIIHADMMKKFEGGFFAKIFRDRGYRLITGETETEVGMLRLHMRTASDANQVDPSNTCTRDFFRHAAKRSYPSSSRIITPPRSRRS